MDNSVHKTADIVTLLCKIGADLSVEKDYNKLFEHILLTAIELTHADGGTLYIRKDDMLTFAVVRSLSLGIAMGGTTGVEVDFAPVDLFNSDGLPNDGNVAAYAALHGATVNIADVYTEKGFNFSGPRAFDKKTGYRSKSFLTIPLIDHRNKVIGVLQLINRISNTTGDVITFSDEDQSLGESLASQVAVSLTNKYLIESLETLFYSFIEMLAHAIDEKSPYTGGHCRRVPQLTMMLADAAIRSQTGPLKGFNLNEQELYNLHIAGWLHDCGKIVTPVHVVDKATKLETIWDRIHLLDARFEAVRRDFKISMLEQQVEALRAGSNDAHLNGLEQTYQLSCGRLEEDREFLHQCNIGGEYMETSDIERVKDIAKRYQWQDEHGRNLPFLTDDELYNLCVSKGTLTPEEREIINDHIVITIGMLKSLNFPDEMVDVIEYAGGHHERMDGKGYPNGLTRNDLSIPARMMAIADIFEALSAHDRPYKKAKTLSESLKIMGYMAKEGHIDPDLFDVFIREQVYLRYAKEFLAPEQIDDINPANIPGYTDSM